jgi:hypothetical protein
MWNLTLSLLSAVLALTLLWMFTKVLVESSGKRWVTLDSLLLIIWLCIALGMFHCFGIIQRSLEY